MRQGTQLLRQAILQPCAKLSEIQKRHSAVEVPRCERIVSKSFKIFIHNLFDLLCLYSLTVLIPILEENLQFYTISHAIEVLLEGELLERVQQLFHPQSQRSWQNL